MKKAKGEDHPDVSLIYENIGDSCLLSKKFSYAE